jgi:hypothetical protein
MHKGLSAVSITMSNNEHQFIAKVIIVDMLIKKKKKKKKRRYVATYRGVGRVFQLARSLDLDPDFIVDHISKEVDRW